MEIHFDHTSIKSTITKTKRLHVKSRFTGRAFNDAFDAKFLVTVDDGVINMSFTEATILSDLESEFRSALIVAVKTMVRSEVKRYLGKEIPDSLAASVAKL